MSPFFIPSADSCKQLIWFNQPKPDFSPKTPASKDCVFWSKMIYLWEKKKKRDILFSFQEVFGYRTQNLRRALCLTASVLTCGVLLLVFYWRPQWRVWANCTPCPLQEADTVLLRTTVRALLCCIRDTTNNWPVFQRGDFPLFKEFSCPHIGDSKNYPCDLFVIFYFDLGIKDISSISAWGNLYYVKLIGFALDRYTNSGCRCYNP